FGGGQLGQTLHAVAGGVVDVFLTFGLGLLGPGGFAFGFLIGLGSFGHGGHIFLQRDQLVLLGGVEQQQVFQHLLVGAVAFVAAHLQLQAEVLEELVVFLAVGAQHGSQLVFDLLLQ